MAKWAVGVRLPGSSIQAIEAAIDNGEILRTHVLRPTWHFVSSDDIRWMLELAVPQIKASLRSRHKDLGLSETIVVKSNAIMEKALSRGEHLTLRISWLNSEKPELPPAKTGRLICCFGQNWME